MAAADSLDYLLYPGLPVLIPDAVVYEATRDDDAIGSRTIIDWMQARNEQVRTITTEVFMSFVRDVELNAGRLDPPRRQKDLGERAAIEAIHDAVKLAFDERALLMTEDDRALRRVLVAEAELTDRMIPLTTRDFLEGLEAARRIQSADEVYRLAQDAGRRASRLRVLKDQHERARQAVEAVLRRPD